MHASKDSMWREILKNFTKFWKLNRQQVWSINQTLVASWQCKSEVAVLDEPGFLTGQKTKQTHSEDHMEPQKVQGTDGSTPDHPTRKLKRYKALFCLNVKFEGVISDGVLYEVFRY